MPDRSGFKRCWKARLHLISVAVLSAICPADKTPTRRSAAVNRAPEGPGSSSVPGPVVTDQENSSATGRLWCGCRRIGPKQDKRDDVPRHRVNKKLAMTRKRVAQLTLSIPNIPRFEYEPPVL